MLVRRIRRFDLWPTSNLTSPNRSIDRWCSFFVNLRSAWDTAGQFVGGSSKKCPCAVVDNPSGASCTCLGRPDLAPALTPRTAAFSKHLWHPCFASIAAHVQWPAEHGVPPPASVTVAVPQGF